MQCRKVGTIPGPAAIAPAITTTIPMSAVVKSGGCGSFCEGSSGLEISCGSAMNAVMRVYSLGMGSDGCRYRCWGRAPFYT